MLPQSIIAPAQRVFSTAEHTITKRVFNFRYSCGSFLFHESSPGVNKYEAKIDKKRKRQFSIGHNDLINFK